MRTCVLPSTDGGEQRALWSHCHIPPALRGQDAQGCFRQLQQPVLEQQSMTKPGEEPAILVSAIARCTHESFHTIKELLRLLQPWKVSGVLDDE